MGLLFFAHLMFLPACIAVPAAIVTSGAMCVRRRRPWHAPVLAASLAWIAALFIVPRWGWNIRREAFAALAERSRPLIEAIEAFEQVEGRPPTSLDELVPIYLPEVPTTGMNAYPRWFYRVTSDGKKSDPVTGPQGNPSEENRWSLSVPCSSGAINFDRFTYWPLKNYPDTRDGRGIERIGDWAYEHE